MPTSVFDHVTIRVTDRRTSEDFYSRLLHVLSMNVVGKGEFVDWGVFSLAAASPSKPATSNAHIAFSAASRELVDAFWQAGVHAGYEDVGAPGPRPEYSRDYYGAFLRDPDGNSVEAVHHGTTYSRNQIDHVWLRVADVVASQRFYEMVATHAGFEVELDPTTKRLHCFAPNGGFTLVRGDPTAELHLAFPAKDDEAVQIFHRDVTAAGYSDNGPPGERPRYAAGYYAAFTLDPDGNTIELVHHGSRA